MSSELTSQQIKVLATEITAMKAEERQQDQLRCRESICNGIMRLAAHVQVIEAEGGSLERMRDDFGTRFVDQLRLIACGMLLPQLVYRFHSKPELLVETSGLPLPDQERLANGDRVPTVVIGPDGRQDEKRRDPLSFNRDEIRQVFARDHIRDLSEQSAWIDRDRMRVARLVVPERIGKIRIDKERGVATFPKKGDYTLAELVQVVKALQK